MVEARKDKNYGAEEWQSATNRFLFPPNAIANTLDSLRMHIQMWSLQHDFSTKGCGQALQDAFVMVETYNNAFEPIHYLEDMSNEEEVKEQVNKFSRLFMMYLSNKVGFFENLMKHDKYFDGGELFSYSSICRALPRQLQ